MPFTEAERTFLEQARLGRVATVSKHGEPDVAPVGFALDGEVIEITGMDNTKTRKYHNVVATGRASFVVDELVTVDPWAPRGVKVTGAAAIGADGQGGPTLRITPETIWSWGINAGAETVFGPIEKRSA